MAVLIFGGDDGEGEEYKNFPAVLAMFWKGGTPMFTVWLL
jgi:hypothetical protein